MHYLRQTSGLWVPEPVYNLPGMVPGPGFRQAGGTTQTVVDVTTDGTWSGTMSSNGGIAAAHDGSNVETGATSAKSSAANGVLATIIIDWGASNDKLISRFKVWSPSDTNMFDGGTGTLTLVGSTDNFSSSNDTLYTATSIAEPGFSGSIDINVTTATTAYRYHKLELTATGGKPFNAELDFWEEL